MGNTVTIERTARQVEPRHTRPFGGCDRGSDGVCLARRLDASGEVVAALAWFSGAKVANAGVRGFGHRYLPARLAILSGNGHATRELHSDGGRLTKTLLSRHASAIDEALGAGVAAALDPRATVIVGPEPTSRT